MPELQKLDAQLASYTPEQKKAFMVKLGATGAGITVIGVASPLIWAAFNSIVPLAGIGVAMVAVYILYRFIPNFEQKLENRILAARKAEARENPIEQMQNRSIKMDERLKRSKQALDEIGASIAGQRRMIEQQAKEDPGHDLTNAKNRLKIREDYCKQKIEKHAEAELLLKEFKKAVKRLQWEKDFADSGETSDAALNEIMQPDPNEEILTEEAVRSIEQRVDKVMASMEIDTILEEARRSRKNSSAGKVDGNIIDAEFTTTK